MKENKNDSLRTLFNKADERNTHEKQSGGSIFESKYFPLVALCVFLALLLVYPVLMMLKKTKTSIIALEAEELQLLQTQDISIHRIPSQQTDFLADNPTSPYYNVVGTALPTVTKSNIYYLTNEDFRLLGSSSGSLLDIVKNNIQNPEIIAYTFDNTALISAFLSRQIPNYMLKSKDNFETVFNNKEFTKFANAFLQNEVVRTALKNTEVIDTISKSKLMYAILTTPAINYYLKRPSQINNIVNANPRLKALKQNKNIQKAIRENPYTRNIAKTILN